MGSGQSSMYLSTTYNTNPLPQLFACLTPPRHVALCDTVNSMKIIVAAAEFCRRDQSQEFKLVWIRATDRGE